MALNKAQLQTDLLTLFQNPSSNLTTLAGQWGDAMQGFFSGVIPASATVAASIAAFKTALVAAFPGGPAAVDAAFTQLAAAIGVGMAPAFVSTPPAVGPFSANMLPYPVTHAEAAEKWAGLIHAWALTGIGTPPVGPPVVWS